MAHTGVVYVRPRFEDGGTTTLGVSGMLWRDALIFYDRRSRSLWSQVDGRAVAGPAEGRRLAKVPSRITTWSSWVARHPRTRVLVKPPLEGSPYESYHRSAGWVGVPFSGSGGDDRLPKKTLVLGLELEGRALAVDLEALGTTRLLEGVFADVPLLIVAEKDLRSALVYDRRVDGTVLAFTLEPGGTLADDPTGTRWDWQTGEALEGPLAGERLRAVAATPIYWATWSSFHPGSAIWGSGAEEVSPGP